MMTRLIYWVKTYKYHKEKHRNSVEARRHVGLNVNTEKTRYIVISHHQNTGQNHNILTTHKSFENVVSSNFLEWQ